jgi:hypothetical protein
MRFTAIVLVPLAGALVAAAASAPPPQSSDGYLARRVDILVYPGTGGFESSGRQLTVDREVSLFAGYLWRHSLRRLSVDARITIVPRRLYPEEFRDYGETFGWLMDRSARVDADLKERGLQPSSLILLYLPPADHPARLAGRTFFEGAHSSIPIRDVYFQDDGFSRPLHLVMAHEFLHQIDIEFSRLHHPAEFLDPDGAGTPEYPSCIDPGGGDLSLRSLLQFNRECRPVRWDLLAPEHGEWISR